MIYVCVCKCFLMPYLSAFLHKQLEHPIVVAKIYAQTNLAKAALNPHKNSCPNCAALAFESDSAAQVAAFSGARPYTRGYIPHASIKGSWSGPKDKG